MMIVHSHKLLVKVLRAQKRDQVCMWKDKIVGFARRRRIVVEVVAERIVPL